MRTNLEKSIERTGIPGISVVSVMPDSNPVTEQAGIIANRDVADKTVVKKDTIFEAASLSKPVFAYIVLKMVQNGELNLNTPLYEYYPEPKEGEGYTEKNGFGPPELREHPNYKKLTAGLILSHQAGLPNEFLPQKNNPALPDFKYVSSDVGKKFDYSGEAYCFLLEVVQKITGKELEQLAQEIFLEMKEFAGNPMTHSSFHPPADISNLAVGHLKDGKIDPQRHFYFSHPAASLYTTAEDYGLFMKACMRSFYKETSF
ncbi:MAG: beta-lactamase family protein [Tatlockia sp.]|nr:beta-lactamase family protein [Tatlockia sp.]